MQITMITAGLLGLLSVMLGLRVSLARRRMRVLIGHGGNPLLQQSIRAHANAMETIPLALILLFLAEQSYGHKWSLILCAGILIAGRLLHPLGMVLRGPNFARILGMLATWGVIATLSVMILIKALRWCQACMG